MVATDVASRGIGMIDTPSLPYAPVGCSMADAMNVM